MSKQIIRNYEFDADAGTLTFPDFDEPMDQSRLALVTNTSKGILLYNFMDPTLRGEMSGNVLTLEADTTGMDGDTIRIDYDTAFGDVGYDRTIVGNARTKFRDGFATSGVQQPNPDTWILQEDTPGRHIITQGGDAAGSSYLRISLDPFTESDGISLTSRRRFAFPMRVGWGVSASQRIQGQEFFVGMIAVDDDGTVPTNPDVPEKPITGTTASVTSNVATFTLTGHGLKGGDRINIYNCADHRMNFGPAAVTIINADSFTIPITIANGSYSTVGGIVRLADPLRGVKNGYGYLFESTSTTTASIVARRNGAKFRSTATNAASTTATQSNTSPYTDAFNSAGNQELYMSMDETVARSFASDSNASTNGYVKFTQGIPDEELQYALHFRARILAGASRPVARVVSAVKAASSTVTVTTDAPHGLAVGDWVQVYGTRDQTNFLNQSTWTSVVSVPSSTTFTTVWGSSATASTTGGALWIAQGQVTAPGVLGQSIQSISRTNGILTLIGNTTWSGPLPGEYMQVYGLEPAAVAYEGAYKTLRVSGTTLELDAPGPDFASISTGGAVFRRTDIRLHFARVMDYTRLVTEIVGGRGNTSDANGSIPVAITGSATVPASQTTGTSSTIWASAGWGGFLVNDVVSAALTGSSTTSAVTPASVGTIGTYAHVFHVAVTAVSGTNPTMDIGIEESPDNGTNWFRVYDFPRITATGSYQSPLIRAAVGTRYRYVRTIGGTSPSFTHAINRIQHSQPGEIHRQFFDRSIVMTTQFSTTPVYVVDGCNFFQVIVSLGATTTAPVLQLQGSEDGTNWYTIGANFTPTAAANVSFVFQDIMPRFCRVSVATAGASVTLNHISIKAVKK